MAELGMTVKKFERINRIRLRYRAGLPVPRSDLHMLGVSVDVAGAKEVIGIWLDQNRDPTLEGSIGSFGPITISDVVA